MRPVGRQRAAPGCCVWLACYAWKAAAAELVSCQQPEGLSSSGPGEGARWADNEQKPLSVAASRAAAASRKSAKQDAGPPPTAAAAARGGRQGPPNNNSSQLLRCRVAGGGCRIVHVGGGCCCWQLRRPNATAAGFRRCGHATTARCCLCLSVPSKARALPCIMACCWGGILLLLLRRIFSRSSTASFLLLGLRGSLRTALLMTEAAARKPSCAQEKEKTTETRMERRTSPNPPAQSPNPTPSFSHGLSF